MPASPATRTGDTFLYIALSDEVQQLVAENDIRLVDALQQDGIPITRTQAPVVGPSREAGLKSPELIILTSAAAVPLIATGIARIIDALGRNRRHLVTGKAWKPVL